MWRTVLSWLFLAIFCLTLPIALLTGWARLVAVDSVVFGRTMATLAADGRVQGAVGRVVAARVTANVAGENPTATEALQSLGSFKIDPVNVAVYGENQPLAQKIYDRVGWK